MFFHTFSFLYFAKTFSYTPSYSSFFVSYPPFSYMPSLIYPEKEGQSNGGPQNFLTLLKMHKKFFII